MCRRKGYFEAVVRTTAGPTARATNEGYGRRLHASEIVGTIGLHNHHNTAICGRSSGGSGVPATQQTHDHAGTLVVAHAWLPGTSPRKHNPGCSLLVTE
mmetsp:Transcript_77839/g.207989  ORF Transcript_77839/g.207989 Transcript_77839/m.207989 type:complete len:99 (+) Transcript_77839:1068-1364(+)